MAHDALDLSILDSGNTDAAAVLARSQNDIATAILPYDQVFDRLTKFKHRIDQSLRGLVDRPTPKELNDFGRSLFSFCIRDDIKKLYQRLPNSSVRIQILSNNTAVQQLPWEFIQQPGQKGPLLNRSVVRIVPTIGKTSQDIVKPPQTTKILFAAADPTDQTAVSWVEVKNAIENAFNARINDGFENQFEIKVEEAVTPQKLTKAVADNDFDIFHFSGHGIPGHLLLNNRRSNKTHKLSADQLVSILSGRDVRLVVLSACDTAAGDFSNDFGVTAAALVREGIPAVVANQSPIPDQTVATFSGSFYKKLIKSGDVDLAMNEGRIMLSVDLGSPSIAAIEWGVPTLYRHFANPKIFHV